MANHNFSFRLPTVVACFFCIFTFEELFAQDVLLQESFESGFPSGWSVQRADSTSDGYQWGNSGTLSSTGWTIDVGSNFLATNDDACNCNKSADRLRLPPLVLDTVAAARLAAKCYFNKGTFGGFTEAAQVQASLDGTTWSTLLFLEGDADWQDVLINLQDYVGQPLVYLSFLYNDGGGWSFGLAVDDVLVFEPPAKDIRLTRIAPDWVYFASVPVTMKATIQNMGRDTLNSCEIAYRVDGGPSVPALISGLSLEPLDTLTITHPVPWSPAADTSLRVVEVSVLNPDGSPDATPADNTRTWRTRALDAAWTTDRTVLLEHFTSTNSGSAAAVNPGYHALVDALEDVATNVSYHVWWPFTTDPFYNAYPDAAESRAPFYGISLVPQIRMDGKAGPSLIALDADDIMARKQRPALFDLSTSLEPDSGRYRILVRAEALVPYWYDAVTLHVVLIERFVAGPNTDPFASPESSFTDVVRLMLPDADGTLLLNPTAGSIYENEWLWNPNADWADLSDISIVAFVQEPTTGEVLQALEYRSAALGLDSEMQEAGSISIHPNPVASTLFVDMPSAFQGAAVHWMVYDDLGVCHVNGQWSPLSTNRQEVDVSDLQAGIYWLVLRSGQGETVSRALIKK